MSLHLNTLYSKNSIDLEISHPDEDSKSFIFRQEIVTTKITFVLDKPIHNLENQNPQL